MSTHLSKEDYAKILQFTTTIQNYENDIEYNILRLLDKLFDYEYGVYMHYDAGQLIRGVFYNLAENYQLNDYKAHEKDDPLNKYIQSSDFYQRIHSDDEDKSISIKDIMPYSDYEKTQHYKHLMNLNLYYQLTVYPNIDNTTEDSIAVFRKKNDDDFTNRDRIILSYIANVVSPILTKFKSTLHLKKKIEFFKSNNEILPFGLVIYDEHFEVTDYNDLAIIYASSALVIPELTQLDKGLINMIFDLEEKATFSLSGNSVIEKSINTYTFKLFPQHKISISEEIRKYYVLHIYKSKVIETTEDINNIFGLTQRELEIALSVIKGLSNKEIMQKLCISKSTTQTHLENLYRKAGVHSRTELILKIHEVSL